jgi:CelD/BcsL family acetyltransferase involved in cellulose biosynthesis
VAPLLKHRTTLRGLRVRELRFLENGIGPRNDILVSSRVRPEEAAVALLDCLARQQREWDLATLANIDEQASCLEAMRLSAPAYGIKLLEEAGRTSPLITLEDDFEQYFSRTFDRKHRYNIRRSVRDAEEKLRSAVACFSGPHDVAPALQQAFRVSRASWKGQQNTDMGGCELRRAFYEEVTQRFAELGVIQIWLLELDDQPAAIQYQLVSGTSVYLLVSDFAAQFHGHSPGTVLLYRVLEQLCRQGIREFDFCGEAYDYKMRWSTGVRRHVTLQLFGRTGYARGIFWAKTGLLPLLRRLRRVSRRSSALLA